MSNETNYRLHTRNQIMSRGIEEACDKLFKLEAKLEKLLDDSNPNKDAVAALKECIDINIHARILLAESLR